MVARNSRAHKRRYAMKKKLLSILALCTSAILLTSCASVSKKISFMDNWASNIFDSPAEGATETLTYAVTFEKGTGLHEEAYVVEYGKDKNGKKDGEYTTTFTYANGQFTYTTTLTLPVLYTFGGEQKEFTDEVKTTAVFASSQNSLRPVSSKKEVKSVTPSNYDAQKWEECYTEYHYEVNVAYAENKGNVTWTNLSQENNIGTSPSSFEIDDKEFTYLDNEQILFAIRGFQKNAFNTTQTVLSYDVSKLKMRKVEIRPSSPEGEHFDFTVNGTAVPAETAIGYIPVSMSYTDDKGGAPQTLWYAQMETDADGNPVNLYRNALLYMEVSAPYAIGTLKYSLKTAIFA